MSAREVIVGGGPAGHGHDAQEVRAAGQHLIGQVEGRHPPQPAGEAVGAGAAHRQSVSLAGR